MTNIKNGTGTTIETWQIPQPQPAGEPALAPDIIRLVGFTDHGYVVSVNARDEVQIWDPARSTLMGQIALPVGDSSRWKLRGDELSAPSADRSPSITLDPHARSDHLCRAAGGPFTDAERQLLPVGATDQSPCDG